MLWACSHVKPQPNDLFGWEEEWEEGDNGGSGDCPDDGLVGRCGDKLLLTPYTGLYTHATFALARRLYGYIYIYSC